MISVVSVRTESRQQKEEERMQILIDLGLFLAFTIYALGVVYLGTELQNRKGRK